MALYIKNPNVEKSARRLRPAHGPGHGATLLERDLLRIAHQCAALPDLDTRTADEILEYDAEGLPG